MFETARQILSGAFKIAPDAEKCASEGDFFGGINLNLAALECGMRNAECGMRNEMCPMFASKQVSFAAQNMTLARTDIEWG